MTWPLYTHEAVDVMTFCWCVLKFKSHGNCNSEHPNIYLSGAKPCCACSELRLKDIERVSKHFEGVKALEKRGFTKEQKEELVICEKVLNWLQDGKDVRWAAMGSSFGWRAAIKT